MQMMARWLAGLALVTVSSLAHTLPIVTVDGKEWLQPKDFIDLTWNTIAGVCDPVTGDCGVGSLGPVTDMDSWTWASVDDLNALMNTLGGGWLGPGPDSEIWVPYDSWFPAFLAAGFALTYDIDPAYRAIFGITRTVGFDVVPEGGPVAYFGGPTSDQFDDFCCDIAYSNQFTPLDDSPFLTGGWFFRTGQVSPPAVPISSTAALFGLGLAALRITRRTRNN